MRKNLSFWIGIVLLAFMVFMACIGPWLTSYSYFETHLASKNLPPSTAFWFGTDELGRDLFTRCWWGARISFFIGLSASLIDLSIGVLYGALAGFLGKRSDEFLMRIADVLHSIPYLLVVVLWIVMIGPGIVTVILALSCTGWINMARIVRSKILELKEREFVLAARALGASRTRILFVHLIPNAYGPIIVTLTLTIPLAMFTEAFLSFLGLGVQAPVASWGTMIHDGLSALRFYPWRLFFPASLMSISMLGLTLVGDALRDDLDPRSTQ
jgi:oligopeptide transport system permease protein